MGVMINRVNSNPCYRGIVQKCPEAMNGQKETEGACVYSRVREDDNIKVKLGNIARNQILDGLLDQF